jgi:hypothetical protein
MTGAGRRGEIKELSRMLFTHSSVSSQQPAHTEWELYFPRTEIFQKERRFYVENIVFKLVI